MMRRHIIKRQQRSELWKGVVAGAVAGVVASWMMMQFEAVWERASRKYAHGDQDRVNPGDRGSPERLRDQEHDATMRVAKSLAAKLDMRLDTAQLAWLAAGLHYLFGAASAVVYGAAAEITPRVTAGGGASFGAAVWLAGDEVALPALGLLKDPREYPWPVHVNSLAAHVVYGLTTEATRRALRRALRAA